jgi:hypothetical protein
MGATQCVHGWFPRQLFVLVWMYACPVSMVKDPGLVYATGVPGSPEV